MYSRNIQGASPKYGHSRVEGKEHPRSRGEVRRVRQLVACLVIFMTVFVGKGVFPERLNRVGAEMLELMGSNTDFEEIISDVGHSLSGKGSVLEEVGEFCIAVFGSSKSEQLMPETGVMPKEEQQFLASLPDYEQMVSHNLRMEEVPLSWLPDDQIIPPERVPAAAVPAVGTVLLRAEYQGPELPEGYTMDHISLGGLATVTPVLGPLWSQYGYRAHPIDGERKFHNGVDIGAEEGTSVAAFAGGTVEYTGENSIYGNYLQLDHGHGIKSFYAHCSQVIVRTGQQVSAGEPIAYVGSTGSATGPHLHLELKCGGIHIDPGYYIQTKDPE